MSDEYMQEAERMLRDVETKSRNGSLDDYLYARAALLAHIERGRKLEKPARVGNGTFGIGVAERLVIAAAQRHCESEAANCGPKTPEQIREDERLRRKGWEMFHGPLDADIERERVPEAATRAMEAAAEDYWNSLRFSVEPRTWAGVWAAMFAAAPAAPALRAQVDDYIVRQLTAPNAEQLIIWLEQVGLKINDAARDVIESFVDGMRSAPDHSGWTQPEVRALATPEEMQRAMAEECMAPPPGWRCTREAGHEGPCAAVESPEDAKLVEKAMQRLRAAGYFDSGIATAQAEVPMPEPYAVFYHEGSFIFHHFTREQMQKYGDARESAGYAQILDWAVGRWKDEVQNRPLQNHNRRPLDDVWRQVVRRVGGDPDELLGPSHDALLAAQKGGE